MPPAQQPLGGASSAGATCSSDTAACAAAQEPVAEPAAAAAPLVVLMYGPPLSGTSTQAALLSSRYGRPVVSVDGLLQQAYSILQAEAATTAVATPAASPGSPRPGRNRQLCDQLAQLLFCSSTVSAAEAGSLSPSSRLQAAAAAQRAAVGAGVAQHHQPAAHDVVKAALQLALQQEEYSQGYIVDGLNSKHLPSAAVVARCLLQAAGLTCKALQPSEGSPQGAAAAAAAKGVKAASSRPPSGKPSSKAVPAAPEPVPPILSFTTPDVWEGPLQVSHSGLLQLQDTSVSCRCCHSQGSQHAVDTGVTVAPTACSLPVRQSVTCLLLLHISVLCTVQVHVIQLQLGMEEAARRYAAAAAAAAAGLEVADLGAEASQGLLGEASFMLQQQQQSTQGGEDQVGCALC